MAVDQAALDFDRHRKHIAAALEYAGGTHTLEDVRASVLDGSLQIWPGVHSVILTQVLQQPRKRVLHVFLAGGDLAEIKQLVPTLYEFGRAVGCSTISLLGRKGWERTFLTKADGWTAPLTYMEKEL